MEVALVKRVPKVVVDGLAILGGSILLALLAQCALPLPFTPIPVTLQTLGLALIACTLGSKRAFLAVAAYLVEGALGFPVFSGAMGGLGRLLGPPGGYLVGFLASAYLMGYLFERGAKNSYLPTLGTLLLGDLLVLSLGTLWLTTYLGFTTAVTVGFFPFLLGSAAKISLSSGLIRLARVGKRS